MFYEYSRKTAAEGYCSHCRRMVPITGPKHNKEGICPKCKAKVTYKAAGKISSLATDEYYGQIIQKIKGGAVVRKYRQRQWYRDTDYITPKSYLYETERVLLMDDGTVKRYYYGLYKNKKRRFILDKDYRPTATLHREIPIKLYKKNLNSIKKTKFADSTIDLWDKLPCSVTAYLILEKKNPIIEKLVKIGMFRMAADVIEMPYSCGRYITDGETELIKALRIDKARFHRLKANGGGIKDLRWYQMEKQENTIWSDAMIKDFARENFSMTTFDFLPVKVSYAKIWNYLRKQAELSGNRYSTIVYRWVDYLNMAKKAKMDIRNEMIWKPKDLKAAHDGVVMLLQRGEMEKEAKKLEKKWPKVNGQLPKLQKFEYADKKYCIVAPKNICDIVKEGRILQHCVHTCDFYFDRIQKDESYLFFLRKTGKEDIPWYTLEVEPNGNIRQKRTTGDNQNKDFEDAVRFLKKWQKFFIKQLTDEEKALGVKADQARTAEYAKLRKDGNKVWHGRLAGQLLADVLEKDFMAAI